MTSSSQPRLAKYAWCDRPDIIVSYSRTMNSRINAAVKIEGGYLRHVRPKAASILQIYVRKTTTINKDALRGRNVPREYETWSSLRDHPYILACEDFQWVVKKISLDEVTFWSKRCEYGDLGRFVLNGPHQTMKLSKEQAEEVVCQIISALAFIHHGLYIIVDKGGHIKELDFGDHELLIHRDIKPENSGVFLTPLMLATLTSRVQFLSITWITPVFLMEAFA
jgi:serine/threonine protein kinase